MLITLKRRIYLILDPDEQNGFWHKIINAFIILLIVLNTLAVIAETVNPFYKSHEQAFRVFEIFSVAIFSVEYLLRVWSITENPKYSNPISGRLRYIFTPGALIDLVAVAPFYLPLVLFVDLRFLRIFRLFRFFRFFKLGRYVRASKLLGSVFRAKKHELIMSLVITICLIIVSASFMYYAEHDVQPNKFTSIPETMWWSVATLTTVGYRDMYPVTMGGKILESIISILGIGMLALPTGILASGFSEELKHKKKKNYCHNCGHELD